MTTLRCDCRGTELRDPGPVSRHLRKRLHANDPIGMTLLGRFVRRCDTGSSASIASVADAGHFIEGPES